MRGKFAWSPPRLNVIVPVVTAMTGNVPIETAHGNGIFAPAGYLVATVVLTLFTIGYVSMARHITTAAAFYGFVSHRLGQVWGMANVYLFLIVSG